jgi:hypothetical protein
MQNRQQPKDSRLEALPQVHASGRNCLGNLMQSERLTPDECDELAGQLRQDVAVLSKKGSLLKLSEGYRDLANIKRSVLRKVNRLPSIYQHPLGD